MKSLSPLLLQEHHDACTYVRIWSSTGPCWCAILYPRCSIGGNKYEALQRKGTVYNGHTINKTCRLQYRRCTHWVGTQPQSSPPCPDIVRRAAIWPSTCSHTRADNSDGRQLFIHGCRPWVAMVVASWVLLPNHCRRAQATIPFVASSVASLLHRKICLTTRAHHSWWLGLC